MNKIVKIIWVLADRKDNSHVRTVLNLAKTGVVLGGPSIALYTL